jgi:hypothetical protein
VCLLIFYSYFSPNLKKLKKLLNSHSFDYTEYKQRDKHNAAHHATGNYGNIVAVAVGQRLGAVVVVIAAIRGRDTSRRCDFGGFAHRAAAA